MRRAERINAADFKSHNSGRTVRGTGASIGKLSLFILALHVAAPVLADDFVACHGRDTRKACVYDGDTIWFEIIKIRAAGGHPSKAGKLAVLDASLNALLECRIIAGVDAAADRL